MAAEDNDVASRQLGWLRKVREAVNLTGPPPPEVLRSLAPPSEDDISQDEDGKTCSTDRLKEPISPTSPKVVEELASLRWELQEKQRTVSSLEELVDLLQTRCRELEDESRELVDLAASKHEQEQLEAGIPHERRDDDYIASIKERQMSREPIPPLGRTSTSMRSNMPCPDRDAEIERLKTRCDDLEEERMNLEKLLEETQRAALKQRSFEGTMTRTESESEAEDPEREDLAARCQRLEAEKEKLQKHVQRLWQMCEALDAGKPEERFQGRQGSLEEINFEAVVEHAVSTKENNRLQLAQAEAEKSELEGLVGTLHAQIRSLEARLASEEQETTIGAVTRCEELTRQKAEVEKELGELANAYAELQGNLHMQKKLKMEAEDALHAERKALEEAKAAEARAVQEPPAEEVATWMEERDQLQAAIEEQTQLRSQAEASLEEKTQLLAEAEAALAEQKRLLLEAQLSQEELKKQSEALYSDSKIKENVEDADLQTLMQQIKHIRIREFDHGEDEFFNKFFSRRQLGIMAHELKPVMPTAVGVLPERRWTNPKGVTNQTKNVMLIRDTHLLFAALGAVQLLAKKADVWDEGIEQLFKDNVKIVEEQDDNRRKREELLEQLVRVVAKVEVMQFGFAKTEESVARVEGAMTHHKQVQQERHDQMLLSVDMLTNKSLQQDLSIATFQEDFRAAVDREARADLVEKRKQTEAELEVQLVKRSIEKLRWEEEQKTITLRAEEDRKKDEHSTQKHHERVAFETSQKKAADLELLSQQEESNLRQQAQKHKDEKELLELRLKSDERRAELGVQEAIERAKIEEEGKIKAARENEDVNTRFMQAEQAERRAQMLAGIQAAATVASDWVHTVFSSATNLALLIGSIVTCLGGIYLVREMAILLREQLNKRLGRPSLVRMTNRRGTMQQFGIGLLRLLRLRPPHGTEFNDVVLHPKLRQQVMRLADATSSAKRRRMPLQHAMFYGPPGTGKTMVAQRFAEYSGLEYAIMSGGDVAPLEEQAVTELHKLFRWVHRSSRGVLLFIDEADAFLASRKNSGMSETMRNALTTMLYHTGTPSSQFMLVLTKVIATNRPHDLDSAILDRLDESVEFGLPDVDARKGMVQLYYDKYIAKPLRLPTVSATTSMLRKPPAPVNGFRSRLPGSPKPQIPREEEVDEAAMAIVAERIHGFSGREISKLFTSLQTHVLYSDRTHGRAICTKSMLLEVVDQKVAEHGRSHEFQTTGYEYRHTEAHAAHGAHGAHWGAPHERGAHEVQMNGTVLSKGAH